MAGLRVRTDVGANSRNRRRTSLGWKMLTLVPIDFEGCMEEGNNGDAH